MSFGIVETASGCPVVITMLLGWVRGIQHQSARKFCDL